MTTHSNNNTKDTISIPAAKTIDITNRYCIHAHPDKLHLSIENINRTIKTIKRNANGYKNFERLRKRIMWCVNKEVSIVLIKRKVTKNEEIYINCRR